MPVLKHRSGETFLRLGEKHPGDTICVQNNEL